ncbi:MAG TPA: hypothetical protein VKX17_23885 [Planctomycetota bacterium]|nr:hypothetical protein [Planctomycetota bacterium]
MQSLYIILLCIGAAIFYGVVHDQLTARICVEYFTIGHPRIFDTDDPTLLALGWGVIATWWVGLLLGIPMACAARCGERPKRSARSLIRPLSILLFCMAGISLLAGLVGYLAAQSGAVYLLEPLASRVPTDKHAAFLTDLWMHLASYGAGFIGGLILCWRIYRGRKLASAVGA